MRKISLFLIAVLTVAGAVVTWRFARIHLHAAAGSAQRATRSVTQSQTDAAPRDSAAANASPERPAPTSAPAASAKDLGPFVIAGRNYTVHVEFAHVESAGESGDTVTAMEIRDAAGAVQYRRTFSAARDQGFFDSWSVSPRLLAGANGTGLLVNYDLYSEPSAPEQEPTTWFQAFGSVNGKIVPFGAPFEIQGGLLDQYVSGNSYKAAPPVAGQADVFEFKLWTGHCRIVFPVRVDWADGKLSPAQECLNSAGRLSAGCEYKVLPEPELTFLDVTFVRLWPAANEKAGQAMKTLVKKDSKIELLAALVPTQWKEGKPSGAGQTVAPLADEAGGFAAAPDSDLWLKVRIDGKEGWIHSQEDFRALGLPEDE